MPLADPHFWSTDNSVTRLRACHVMAWSAGLAALTLVAPVRYADTSRLHPALVVLLIVNILVVVAAVATTASTPVTGRGGPSTDQLNSWMPRFQWVAVAVLIVSLTAVGCSATQHYPNSPTSKALVAVARSILVIVWHLLNDPTARFHDLGPGYHTNRIATERRVRNHIRPTHRHGLPGHPRTRRLNQTHTGTTSPGSARPAGYCRLPTHLGYFSDQN